MRVFTTVPQHDLRRVPAAAREAEAQQYDGIISMENQHDPFLALAVAGVATERVELHTGVAISFARTPMAVAQVGWDLAGSTGGRFVIGLGSQVRGHNERRFSVPWTPPAPRMREYVQVLRAIWRCWKTGEKPAYEGQHYRFTLMTPNFTPPPIEAPPPAVMIAAVGPAMLKVAAEECDGAKLHGFCTRKYLTDEIMPRIEAGLAKTGPNGARSARITRSPAAAFSPPARTMPPWRSASSGCASASRSTARPLPITRCWRCTGWKTSATSSTRWCARANGANWPRRCQTMSRTCSPRSAATTRSSARSKPASAASSTR